MTHAGDVPRQRRVNQPRITVLKTAQETGGDLLELEAVYQPGGNFPPMHYHSAQDEHFEVRSGQVDLRIAGQTHTYRAGESFDVPRGTPHTMRNSGDDEAEVLWQVRPALKTQTMQETLRGLAADGKTNQQGVPNLLQMAVLLQEYAGEFVLVSPPRPVQVVLIGVLGFIGRLCGYRGRYAQYSG